MGVLLPPDSPCPVLDDAATFSIHRHLPSNSNSKSGGSTGFQVVTQSLNILPEAEVVGEVGGMEGGGEEELDRLRRDMKKLRDYLKTSVQVRRCCSSINFNFHVYILSCLNLIFVQERRFLLKKIGTLNEKIAEKGIGQQQQQQQFGARGRPVTAAVAAANASDSRYLLFRISDLQERLAATCQDADLLRTHLEHLSEELSSAASSAATPALGQLAETIRRVVQDSRWGGG